MLSDGDVIEVTRDAPELEVVAEQAARVLTRFIGTTAELVSDQKQNLDCLFSDLGGVVRLAGSDPQLANLSRQLRDGPTAFGYFHNTHQ
jgi:hypothetical protein